MTVLLLLLSLAPCAPAVEQLELFGLAARLIDATCPVRLPARAPRRTVPEWEV